MFFEGGVNIEGEDDSYDFGSGAGFYVDATVDKWKTHYRMYSYVTKEVRVPMLFSLYFLHIHLTYFQTSGIQKTHVERPYTQGLKQIA